MISASKRADLDSHPVDHSIERRREHAVQLDQSRVIEPDAMAHPRRDQLSQRRVLEPHRLVSDPRCPGRHRPSRSADVSCASRPYRDNSAADSISTGNSSSSRIVEKLRHRYE